MDSQWGVGPLSSGERQYRVREGITGGGRLTAREGGEVSTAEYEYDVGVDWATTAQRVVILDATRAPVADQVVDPTGPALTALADEVASRVGGALERLAVAIEGPWGPVVETVLERGFAVLALNPEQLDRFRDCSSPAGAKDDRRDARVLADALATDRGAFRRLRPDTPRSFGSGNSGARRTSSSKS